MPIAKVRGIELYYETSGEGAPILLLPGLARGTNYFSALTPLLEKSCHVIAVDPRGIGRSTKGQTKFTAEEWAGDFAALLTDLKMERVHVLGASQGGCVAMAMADAYPEKVQSLILVGAFSEIDRFVEINLRLRMRLAMKVGMGEDMRDFIALWTLGHEYLEGPAADATLEMNLASVKAHDPAVYAGLCESMLHWGRRLPGQEGEPLFTERLAKFRQPTLVIAGDRDYWLPAKFSKIIAERISGAKYVEIADCGHLPVRERPQETCKLVVDFLSAQGGARKKVNAV